MYELEFYDETYKLEAYGAHYSNNDSVAVILEDVESGEQFCVLTVNLTDGVAEGEYQYVDTNNCPFAEQFIIENELGEPTGIIGYSGFCQYPLYKFNLDKIKFVEN